MVNKPFPWLCADTGALDLVGNPNGECAMAEVVWDVADPLVYVRPCTLPHPVMAPWRGTNSIPSWSWAGCEGVKTTVEVYTKAPIVKLYLNSRCVAVKRPHECHADFRVRYEPGNLVALACTARGEVLGKVTLQSAAGPLQLSMTREPRRLPGSDGAGDLVFVDVAVTDEQGIVEASSAQEVRVTVSGGKLVAFGSAAQKSERSYLEGCFPLRYGRGLAVVRLGEGPCVIAAEADGVVPAVLTL
jgi:beta-galactosidase